MKAMNILKQAVLTAFVALTLAGAVAPRTDASASKQASIQANHTVLVVFGGKDGNETHG